LSKTDSVSHHAHSIILSDRRPTYTIYEKIWNYLSNGRAVVYAAEPNPSHVIQKMSKMGGQYSASSKDVQLEDYVATGALTVVDKDEVYSTTNQFDIDKLLRSWHSLILKAKGKPTTHKRVVAIGAPSSFLQTSNIEKLFEYEGRIISSEKIPKTIETICWYNDPKLFAKLRYSQLLMILNDHDASIHRGWWYRRWYSDNIIAFVCDGIDNALGEGASKLIFKTLMMVYNLDKETVVSQPELFEEKVTKIIGKRTAELAFEIIADTIRKEMAFDRIAEIY